jgi:hypothetical protein
MDDNSEPYLVASTNGWGDCFFEEEAMFNGKRYIQHYLQVFTLRTVYKGNQLVLTVQHKQEVPDFEQMIVLEAAQPMCEKVYLIDDQTHCTMLLAEEY